MLRFSFRRDKEKEFKHIAPGLIPAASIAPKPAVPRTPPPRSPDPSPERPRSALAAAILSSSLTGQTWALPPTRPRSFSEGEQSESLISEPNISTALYTRDRWSEDLVSRQRLSSPEQSDEELDHQEEEEEVEVEDEADKEEHVYQSLDRQEKNSITEPVYALPLKPRISTPQPTRRSVRRAPSPDFTEESSVQSPGDSCSSKKKYLRKKSSGTRREAEPSRSSPPILTTDAPSQPIKAKNLQPSPEPSRSYSEVQRGEGRSRPQQKKTGMVEEQKLLEERLQRLEQEISHSQASLNLKPPTGREAELQNLRRHAQELVDENDALKMTVHRLNVELSRYQTCFRPLSKHESDRISGLPKVGSPPPWLVDMKYLSPLLLAYDDRMNEKDELLQNTEKEVKRLQARAEEVIKENERLHDEIAKIGGVRQEDCHQLQQQAILVLQENQVLIDQLEAQHVKAKESLSKHHAEVSKVSKQLMLLEAEKQRLQEELEESRRELQKNTRDVQVLQARLKDAVTWDEHCHITGKLRRQLEQQESRSKSENEELRLRLSSLQEENRTLALDKADLTADLKKIEIELDLTRQANRKAERRMSVLKRQKEECVLTEEKTRQYMGAVVSVAQHISQERDQLIQMASLLQQEKQGFIHRLVKGTARFGKLQEEVKVYRRQASTRLAVLEEATEGRTASHQREILHLQRLLTERQEAEERLLQSKREVEEELEAVWQAATRENRQMRDLFSDSNPPSGVHRWDVSTCLFPPDEIAQSPRPLVKSDTHSDQNIEDKHKHGLDFYC